jgi:hypothetical protein
MFLPWIGREGGLDMLCMDEDIPFLVSKRLDLPAAPRLGIVLNSWIWPRSPVGRCRGLLTWWLDWFDTEMPVVDLFGVLPGQVFEERDVWRLDCGDGVPVCRLLVCYGVLWEEDCLFAGAD